MQIVCSWCDTDLGTKPCEAAADGTVSHTICPVCQENFRGALRLKLAEKFEAQEVAA